MRATIIIPTRNRLVDLTNTLKRCLELDDPDLEILVYDDCSDVDPTPIVKRDFPRISIWRSDKPVGPCELRNRMIQEASGKYIIGLDDDSCFMSRSDYDRALELADKHTESGLIGFKILRKGGIQFPIRVSSQKYYTAEFMACGYIALKEALVAIGGFSPEIVRAGEERDITIRLLDRGWKPIVSLNVNIFHAYTLVARNDQVIHHYAFRNELLFYLKYFPGSIFFICTIKSFLAHTFFCLKKMWFKAYISALVEYFYLLPSAFRSRSVVKVNTVRKYLNLLKAPADIMDSEG